MTQILYIYQHDKQYFAVNLASLQNSAYASTIQEARLAPLKFTFTADDWDFMRRQLKPLLVDTLTSDTHPELFL